MMEDDMEDDKKMIEDDQEDYGVKSAVVIQLDQ